MWIIYQILGCLLVFIAQSSNRKFGFSVNGVSIYFFINLFLCYFFPKSYELAPNFYSPYFLGVVLLSVFGVIGSYFIFNDNISTVNVIGILVAFVGCILINI